MIPSQYHIENFKNKNTLLISGAIQRLGILHRFFLTYIKVPSNEILFT